MEICNLSYACFPADAALQLVKVYSVECVHFLRFTSLFDRLKTNVEKKKSRKIAHSYVTF